MARMTMAEAFDEWMRKYIEDPAGFSNTMEDVQAHARPTEDSTASEYGRNCARLLVKLIEHGADAWSDDVPPVVRMSDEPLVIDRTPTG